MEMLQANKMSRSLKALCDVNRIRILEILVKGEFCVSELVEQLAIDQPKVSHHLAILRSAGIIRSRRDGRHINYSIRPSVHRRVETAEESTDIFDLGELTVTFRFSATQARDADTRPAVQPSHDGQSSESAPKPLEEGG